MLTTNPCRHPSTPGLNSARPDLTSLIVSLTHSQPHPSSLRTLQHRPSSFWHSFHLVGFFLLVPILAYPFLSNTT